MARKRSPANQRGARQNLARRKTLEYVRRLGLRKAARRLDASVRDLRRWLDEGFPKNKLDAAIALGKPGGQFVDVKGTRLAALVKQRGLRVVAALTGLPGTEIKNIVAKRPGARVRFDRDRLKNVVTTKGADKLAATLGTKTQNINEANRLPLTEATLRLKRFVQHYGEDQAAAFLGVTKRQLATWAKKGVPATWETDLDQVLGKRADQGTDARQVAKRRTEKQIAKAIAEARIKAGAWNGKVPRRFWITLKDAERWARLGVFNHKLNAARTALAASKKPQKPTKRRPPPPKAPPRPDLPTGITPAEVEPPGEKPPKPPKPPKQPPEPSVTEIAEGKKRDFLEARVEAFAEGRYPKPKAPWGRITRWKLINRQGIHVYKKVENFIHNIDLVRLGSELISVARKVWLSLEGPLQLMTIRFVFAGMGSGNPFYPDAFVEGDTVNFFFRNLRIYDPSEIIPLVQELLNEIYMVDAEYTMLFLEYVEVVKSIPVQ